MRRLIDATDQHVLGGKVFLIAILPKTRAKERNTHFLTALCPSATVGKN